MQQNKNSTLFPCKKYNTIAQEKGNRYKLTKYIESICKKITEHLWEKNKRNPKRIEIQVRVDQKTQHC